MAGLDVYSGEGYNNQRKEFLYNEITHYVPELANTSRLLYGDLELEYIRMLNQGTIPSPSYSDGARIVPGAKGDGNSDDTAAFQAACDRGGRYILTDGTYIIDSVTLTKHVEFVGGTGVVFKRKAGACVSSAGWAGHGMFEIAAAGLVVSFDGFTYDGNNANQTSVEPDGMFLKVAPPAVVTGGSTTVHINRGRFISGTLGYLLLRGDDVQKRYETLCYIKDCRFFDTVKGKGKDDPSTPTALGYSPTYMMVMDYVKVRTFNWYGQWTSSTGTGEYAACGVNGTFWGGVYANSGESFIYMHGTTTVLGLGRAFKAWNNDAVFTNNAIGAIDMYGNAETLYIENIYAKDTQFTAVRAKGSLKNYTVAAGAFTNCWRALQVGPSSTGPCETVIKVGNVNLYGGTIPQIEFTGTSTGDRLRSVTLDSAYALGPFTNPEGVASQGVIRSRNVERFNGKALSVLTPLIYGIETFDVRQVFLNGIFTDGGTSGLFTSGGDIYNVRDFSVNNTSGAGLNISTNPKKVQVGSGRTFQTTDYGVFCNTTTSEVLIHGVEVDTVAGNNRAFYVAGGTPSIIGCKSNAATHLWPASAIRRRVLDNTWNAFEDYGSAAPTDGTYSVGDKRWNTAPAASGTMGWVCTTAGTPGTWKTFGTISA